MKRVKLILITVLLLIFSVTLFSCGGQVVKSEYGEELVQNGGFELFDENGESAVWQKDGWKIDDARFNIEFYDSQTEITGERYLEQVNVTGNKTMFKQTVNVEPKEIYRVSALIKIPHNLKMGSDGVSIVGAFIGFEDNIGYTEGNITNKTDGWVEYVAYVRIDNMKQVTLCCQLGSNGHTSTGTAYFDNVSMYKVKEDAVPTGASVYSLGYYNPAPSSSEDVNVGGIVFLALGVLVTIVLALACYAALKNAVRKDSPLISNGYVKLIAILIIALALRIICGLLFYGYVGDIDYGFKLWALDLAENGTFGFYARTGADYTPGYLYVLWMLGGLIKLFNASGIGSAFIIKIPAIICDIVSVYLIYRILKKHTSERIALICALFYAIVPVILTNSAVWGQMDSVLAMLLLLSFSFILDKNYTGLFITYTIAVVVKIQAVFAFPAIAAFIIYQFVKNPELRKRFIITFICCIFGFFVLAIPFGNGNPFYVISRYFETVGQYNYYSLNAFGFYGAIGLNFKELAIVPNVLNYIFIALVFGAVVWLYLKCKDRSKLILLTATAIVIIFTFAAKMHERYLFPAIILLLLYCGLSKDKRVACITGGFSLLHFLNEALLVYTCNGLERTSDHFTYGYFTSDNRFYALYIVCSILSVILALYLLYVTYDICYKERIKEIAPLKYNPYGVQGGTVLQKSKIIEAAAEKRKFNRFDVIAITVLTILALFVSFIELGDTKSAQTFWHPENVGEYVTVQVEDGKTVSEFRAYYGISRDANEYVSKGTYIPSYVSAYGSYDGINYYVLKDKSGGEAKLKYEQSATFCWIKLQISKGDYKYYKFVADYLPFNMNEIALFGPGDEQLKVEITDYTHTESGEGANLAFDEQDLVPKYTTYKTGMYFDEIFHARTAYEYVHGINNIKEDTHPPLGKVIIALGIELFGMTPFGWRCMGALFAAALVPLVYLFGKELFKNKKWAVLLAAMMLCSGISLVQGRIATVDTFAVFFIVLSYYFMLKFYKRSFNRHGYIDWLLPLCLAGISFGFAVAVKWTGIYAGIGLLAIYIIVLFKRYKDFNAAKEDTACKLDAELKKNVIDNTNRKIIYSILACAACFIIIPFFIYLLSYIPYAKCESKGLFEAMFASQNTMFGFHSTVTETHGWSSSWYSWPLDIKPVYFYGGDDNVMSLASLMHTARVYARIYTTGNQVLWYTMLAALFMFIAYIIVRKFYPNSRLLGSYATSNWEEMRPTVIFLMIGLASQFLPWIFISRITFFYHYYASVPFISALAVMLCKTYSSSFTKPLFNIGKGKSAFTVDVGTIIYVVYFALIVINFILLFPVLTGIPIRIESARWMFGWLNPSYGV